MRDCIVLDGLPLQVHSAGIAVYTDALVRSAARARAQTDFVLYGMPERVVRALGGLDSRAAPEVASGAPCPANVSWARSALYPLVMGYPVQALPRVLPFGLCGRRPALFHATNYVAPRMRGTPLVVTVHDLALLRFPELGTPSLCRFVARAGARLADAQRVIADSEATARDLHELLGVPPGRIRVIYPGCSARYRPMPRGEAEREAAERLGVSQPYLLHVGTLEPRKNLERLLAAFAELRRSGRIRHKLVCAGAPGWGSGAVQRQIEALELRDAVQLLGPVAVDALPALYAGADAFVYPSLYEGFGLPVIEAMACGTPVVTSNASALPEVAGDAAVLVDAHDVAAIAGEIERLLGDEAMRADLRARGLARARQFTWERCAAQTLATYDEARGIS